YHEVSLRLNTDLTNYSTVKEARFYERIGGDELLCLTCEKKCRIKEGSRGFCGTRVNIRGKLYTIVYGDISSISANPIEKKPFFHFYPGTLALTIGTWSCNFTCPWCQNYEISKVQPDPKISNYISPIELLNIARKNNCRGTSISFNEPTLLLEYSLDLFKLSKSQGFYNTYVSNGYMTILALEALVKAGLDAIKFDVKGDEETYEKYCGEIKAEIVWRNARKAKELGLHVEIVNLVIPGVNDDEECLRRLIEEHLKNLDPSVPIHFTRYHPEYKFKAPPTPVKTLEKARELARSMGVLFPYIGNVPGHKYENTWCPQCGELLIKRFGFILVNDKTITDNKCPKCRYKIPTIR
ncbi:MAG: AmmeMemoRadiSam system radical SAM enzyme, partial [Nitrososphaerota archaeon]|nr:AmmeMemoRadiSam system radical SAM enzyme [Nitrososphaerota archaeon]